MLYDPPCQHECRELREEWRDVAGGQCIRTDTVYCADCGKVLDVREQMEYRTERTG